MHQPTHPSISRAIAHRVFVRIVEDGAYADRALDAALNQADIDSRDASLTTELVYGVLRQARYLDFIIGELITRPINQVDRVVRIALRMGVYEILFLRTPDYSAVDQTVALMGRHKARRGFVNGVLRTLLRKRDADDLPNPDPATLGIFVAAAIRSSVPTWLLQALGETLGEEEALAWARAQQDAPKVILRVNPLEISREDLLDSLDAAEVSAEALKSFPEAIELSSGGSVTALPGFSDGCFTVQDPAAQLVGYLAAPKAEQTILDLCAAPGGKTTHLAELMGGQGRVLAIDLHPHRVGLIEQHAQRLNLRCIQAKAADATDMPALRAVLEGLDIATPDSIVLDAPCTGLGTLRRNPELRSKNRADLKELVTLQRALLDTAAALLPVGGELTYSVCTPTHEEGRGQIREFLQRHPHYSLVPIEAESLAPYVSDDDELGESCFVETWTHRHGCDSFFAAKLRRRK